MTPNALEVLLYVLSALTGLAVGSFLNVCIYRLPRGEFFAKKRSYCPRCGEQIKWYDNIPLLSYAVLRGRCRACGERISPRYPLIEALTCALWVGNYAAYGTSGATLILDVAVSVLIVAAMIDIDTYEIPDSGILTLLVLGLITFAPFWGVSWQDKLIGCVCVSVPMLIICLFGGMGFGDVKLYFVLGLLFGWQKILLIFLLSVVSGGLVSVGWLIYRRARGLDGETGGETDGENDAEPTEETDGNGVGAASAANDAREREIADNDVENVENADEVPICAECGSNGDVVARTDGCAGEPRTDVCATGAEAVADKVGAGAAEGADSVGKDGRTGVFARAWGRLKSLFGASADDGDEDDEDVPRGHMIPFGPFIVLATLVSIYCGDVIISAYKGLLGL